MVVVEGDKTEIENDGERRIGLDGRGKGRKCLL